MSTARASFFVCCVALTTTTGAVADVITANITADNHYALYGSAGSVFSYFGGNELGAAGSPGDYNWSMAENYQIGSGGDFLYIAAWSDSSVAQGVLADFHSSSLGNVLSGDAGWQVFHTGSNRGDGDPHPTAAQIQSFVQTANAGSGWQTPFVGSTNGVQPWSTISGVDSNARWMWANYQGNSDPLHTSTGSGEMLIFRTAIPAPGAVALMGCAGFFFFGRRVRAEG